MELVLNLISPFCHSYRVVSSLIVKYRGAALLQTVWNRKADIKNSKFYEDKLFLNVKLIKIGISSYLYGRI